MMPATCGAAMEVPEMVAYVYGDPIHACNPNHNYNGGKFVFLGPVLVWGPRHR